MSEAVRQSERQIESPVHPDPFFANMIDLGCDLCDTTGSNEA